LHLTHGLDRCQSLPHLSRRVLGLIGLGRNRPGGLLRLAGANPCVRRLRLQGASGLLRLLGISPRLL
jgi:hypothetical protein